MSATILIAPNKQREVSDMKRYHGPIFTLLSGSWAKLNSGRRMSPYVVRPSRHGMASASELTVAFAEPSRAILLLRTRVMQPCSHRTSDKRYGSH
jgi:hypothetical protein